MTCQTLFSPSRRLLSFAVSFIPQLRGIPALKRTTQTSLIEGGIVPAGWRFYSFYSVPSWKHNLSLAALNVQQKWANPDNNNKRKPHDTRQTIWPVNALQLNLFFLVCWLIKLLYICNNVEANPVQRWWLMMLFSWVTRHINEAWIHIMGGSYRISKLH